MRKPNGYWTYDTCYEEAKKYKSRSGFKKKCGRAYKVASDNGWLTDYIWFERPENRRKKWNRETCYNEAKKYNSKNKFQIGSSSAYNVAWKNGWLDDYIWFKNPNIKWDYDACYNEAKKYKSRTKFYKSNNQAYQTARKNGWLDDYTWFSPSASAKRWNYDTCYEKAKKYKSRNEFLKKCVGAYQVALKNRWLDDYTWFSPSASAKKWDHDTCYKEAKKYKSKIEFQKNSGGAYHVARENGWLDDYTWFQKPIVSEKHIYIVYKYEDADTNAVYVGLTNNIKQRHREHCKGHLIHGKRKYDIVYRYFHDTLGKEVPEPIILHKDILADNAKEYEKKYVEQFMNDGKLVLNIAKTGSLGGYGIWTKEGCKNEAKKYKSRSEFAIKSNGAYEAARKNRWLDSYTWFEEKRKKDGYWTYETCYEEAKKYKSRRAFGMNCGTAYRVARKNGWLDEYIWFKEKQKHNYWNQETCFEEAKKYKAKSEFAKKSGGAYNLARKNGWLNDYTWLKTPEIKRKWNRETCRNEAEKYNSRNEFAKNSRVAYQVARKNGWLDDYTWFNKKSNRLELFDNL